METVKYKINAMPSAIDFFGLDYIKSTVIPTIVKQAFKTENVNTFYVNPEAYITAVNRAKRRRKQLMTKYPILLEIDRGVKDNAMALRRNLAELRSIRYIMP